MYTNFLGLTLVTKLPLRLYCKHKKHLQLNENIYFVDCQQALELSLSRTELSVWFVCSCFSWLVLIDLSLDFPLEFAKLLQL